MEPDQQPQPAGYFTDLASLHNRLTEVDKQLRGINGGLTWLLAIQAAHIILTALAILDLTG